ncbi:Type II secretory pathway, component PulK [Serratia quinivorans]|jgi:general secretion pathway protein K|uniref:type II secretion system minor pseudopilin GspK n=1 Tax=Serratia quinivorans TaxID=137545 RepID=UPI002179D96A|nr:type II secretion system minor pseudopilin GspK [Serratia quinivorans]CAI1011931.1 Type II secretory pathway, component PulK [Serratia quinivorans]CAI1047839.1 Type II secretory pathway, component PulK [Serratia quinivorans]CAI1063068.1 Type II secretory pathway, component PulK [Serratia quinivorans]CAI1123341.1 Type II secretory pathway, component PulK [Serratia quinivorans]CAI1863138.1 Type II secretory pathway, component PulK [Serratia quinivorans]
MKQSRGMALLIVLLLLALMAILSMGIQQYWQLTFFRTLHAQTAFQAKWDLLAGEQFARQLLSDSLHDETSVNLGQRWATSGEIRTEDQAIAYNIKDAQSCFNINALRYRYLPDKQKTPQKDQTPTQATDTPTANNIVRQVFDALLANLAFTEEETERIAQALEQHLLPLNSLFSDVSELRAFPFIDRQQYLRLRPWLCALPEGKPAININTLSETDLPLLRALFLNQTSDAKLKQLLHARPAGGWQGLDSQLWTTALAGLRLAAPAGEKLLVTESRYFNLRLVTQGADAGYYLQSKLHYEKGEVTVTGRQTGQGGSVQ